MLGGNPEVALSRFPVVVALLAGLVALGLTACDDGDSGKESKPRRSTTTTTASSTTTTTVPSGPTSSTTIPSGSGTTTPAPVGNCGPQEPTIVAAIGFGVQGLADRAGQYTVQNCRLAPSAQIWAAAEIVPNPGVQLDRSTVVLQRIGALWNVEDTGTSGVGCSSAPANIQTELGLSCPG
jgi:hypothetical protein